MASHNGALLKQISVSTHVASSQLRPNGGNPRFLCAASSVPSWRSDAGFSGTLLLML